eukprot:5191896-Prymnesium_polylepis.1
MVVALAAEAVLNSPELASGTGGGGAAGSPEPKSPELSAGSMGDGGAGKGAGVAARTASSKQHLIRTGLITRGFGWVEGKPFGCCGALQGGRSFRERCCMFDHVPRAEEDCGTLELEEEEERRRRRRIFFFFFILLHSSSSSSRISSHPATHFTPASF